jgi:hypothetical protein
LESKKEPKSIKRLPLFSRSSVKTKKMKNLFLAACLLSSINTFAQWTTNTLLNTDIKDSVGFEETTPLTATTIDGRTWISYFSNYGGGYEMRLQLLDTLGNRLLGSNGFLVSNQPQSTALFRYDLKADASGNAIVAFQDIRSGGNMQVVAYKVDQLGNQLWGTNGIQLIDPIATEGIAPSIGFTNTGNVLIAWNSTGNNPKWVSLTKLDSLGNPLWPNTVRVIDSLSNKKYSRPTMVPCDADGCIIQYVEETGFGLGVSNIYAKRLDINGASVWPAPVHVSTKTTSFFFFIKAIADGNGGYYTAFNTSDASNPSLNDVYVQHVDANGNLWNATGNSACNTQGINRFFANGKLDANGTGFWVLLKATDGNQSQSGVIVQSFNSQGNTLLSPAGSVMVPISPAYDDPYDLSITSDGVIAFYYSGINPSQTIKAVKCDLSGAPMWQGASTDICTRVSGKDDLSAGAYSNGQVVVAWMDNRNDNGIYAQKINNDGSLGNPSVGEIELSDMQLSIFPNPTADYLVLSQDADAPMNWMLTDVDGKTQMGGMVAQQHQIDLRSLPGGIYLLKMQRSETVYYKRIIKL